MIALSWLELIILSSGWVVVIVAVLSRCRKCRDWCCDEEECRANREGRLL